MWRLSICNPPAALRQCHPPKWTEVRTQIDSSSLCSSLFRITNFNELLLLLGTFVEREIRIKYTECENENAAGGPGQYVGLYPQVQS